MPLKKGFSRATLDHNIRDMRAHHSLEEALGASYAIARAAWHERHPGEPLPDYLRETHKRAHRRRVEAEEKKSRRRHNPHERRRTASKKSTTRRRSARRRNPIKREGARARYAGFHGELPTTEERVDLPPLPEVLWVQGRVTNIVYETWRDGEIVFFDHEFKEKSAPDIAVSDDGRQIVLIGGSYEVTDRGIEDR